VLWYRDTRTISVPQLAAHMTHRRWPPDLRLTPDAALVLEEVLFTAGYARHASPPRSVPSAAPPQRLHGVQQHQHPAQRDPGWCTNTQPNGTQGAAAPPSPPVHHLETDNCNTVNRAQQ